MKKIIVLLPIIALLSSCRNDFENLDFIIGNWGNENDSTNKFYESWQKVDENKYAGKAYTLAGNDTAFSEVVELKFQNGVVEYSPSVKDQNEGKSVPFKLSKVENDDIFWFTNPTHDFPTAIVYKKISDDSMLVWIEGTVYGELKREYFPMARR